MDKIILPAPPASPPASSKPQVLCGSCHTPMDDFVVGHSARCQTCGRSVDVPSHVRLDCARCGRSQRVRLREIATERLCAKCSQPLTASDVVLPVRRRRHYRRWRHRGSSAHADAAWAVLIVGLTLVIAVLALTVL